MNTLILTTILSIITPLNQGTKPWCWATVAAMAANHFYGSEIRPCDAAGLYFEYADCCDMSLKSCDIGLYPEELRLFFEGKLDMEVNCRTGPLPFRKLAQALDDGKLIVIIRQQVTADIVHAYLVYGHETYSTDKYTYTYLKAIDPAGGKRIKIKFTELLFNFDNRWVQTFFLGVNNESRTKH